MFYLGLWYASVENARMSESHRKIRYILVYNSSQALSAEVVK